MKTWLKTWLKTWQKFRPLPAALGLAAAVVVLAGGAGCGGAARPAAVIPPRPLTREERIEARLAEADARVRDAIPASTAAVRRQFAAARRGARGYAEEVLSWNGKWELAKQAIDDIGVHLGGHPKTATHAEYLSAEFKRRVLDADDLKKAVDAALQAFLAEAEAAEGDALVALRADVDTAPAAVPEAELAELDDEFRRRFADKIDATAREVALATGQEAAALGTSLVAGQVVTNVAVAVAAELGISSVVLGGGAVSSVASLGASVVIGLVVDEILAAILKECGYDPAKKVAAAVTGSLDDLERTLTGSLEAEMRTLHERRSKLRREAVAALLKEPGGAK